MAEQLAPQTPRAAPAAHNFTSPQPSTRGITGDVREKKAFQLTTAEILIELNPEKNREEVLELLTEYFGCANKALSLYHQAKRTSQYALAIQLPQFNGQ